MPATVCVNLIPARRREAKARAAHKAKWASFMIVYVVATVLAYLVCDRHALPNISLKREAHNVSGLLDAVNRQVLSLNQDIAAVQQKLQTARAVGRQPDWSALTAMVARNLGDNVVLDLCRLQRKGPSDKTAARPDAAPGVALPEAGPSGYLLELSGFAKAQADVADFVLRLERTGLFDRVRMVRTTRQPFLDGKAVAFRLECGFGERGPNGDAPP
ncbi:MAG: PilN domain-containing protein [Phycisphaerae bacterium]